MVAASSRLSTEQRKRSRHQQETPKRVIKEGDGKEG